MRNPGIFTIVFQPQRVSVRVVGWGRVVVFKQKHPYCWWKKICTGWEVVYPINCRVSYMSGGAEFLPSTVWHMLYWWELQHMNHQQSTIALKTAWCFLTLLNLNVSCQLFWWLEKSFKQCPIRKKMWWIPEWIAYDHQFSHLSKGDDSKLFDCVVASQLTDFDSTKKQNHIENTKKKRTVKVLYEGYPK